MPTFSCKRPTATWFKHYLTMKLLDFPVQMEAVRKSARLLKNSKHQGTEARLVRKKGPSAKGKSTESPKPGRRSRNYAPTKLKAKPPAKGTAKSSGKRITNAPAKGTAKRTGKGTAKGAAKITAKSHSKRSIKAATVTTKSTPKVTPKSNLRITPKISAETTGNGSVRTRAKRKAEETAIDPGSGSKKVKTVETPGTTPRRKRALSVRTKSTPKKSKSSPVQFDYGVPSPIDTERESVDDDDSLNQLLARAAQRVIARTKQGHRIRIQLDPPKTFKFKSERARKLWETFTKDRGEAIKKVIETRDFVPDWLKRQLEGSLDLTDSQRRSIFNEDKSRRTHGMVEWLKLEEKAIDLDADIKSSLRKDFEKTDLDSCIGSLDNLLNLSIDPLTLKKYPDLAMTPCLLQKYKGGLTQWTLTSQQAELFCRKRDIIWEKAKALQKKYMVLFGVEDDTKYAEIFKQRLENFRNSVADLTEDEISLLAHDPSSKKLGKRKNTPSSS